MSNQFLNKEDYLKNNTKSTKKKYISPKIDVQVIHIEFDISITSSNMNSGGNTSDSPKVEEWKDHSGGTYDIEF